MESLTIKQVHKKFVNREISCKEIVQEFLDTIKEKDGSIHAFLEVNEKDALKQAERVDKKLAKGEELGILEGVPIAIKDNILTEGFLCTAGSRILEKYRAPYDATAIKKLRERGVIFLGKTNLDEFAMGSSTETSAFGPTRNPHDPERVPGGSSGGSAAAVAAGMCPAALGSDTAGSIRQPAAFCGVVGFKPTYGAVSRYGLIAMACSFDQIGIFARTARDMRVLFDVMRGMDRLDATSFDATADSRQQAIKGLKIGIPKEYFSDSIDPRIKKSVEEAIGKYEKNGACVEEISLPHTEYVLPVYYIIAPSEISSNLARYDGMRYGLSEDAENLLDIYKKTRQEGFGREVRRRIMLGTHTLSSGYYDAYYLRAQKVRALVKQDFDKAFSKIDVIMTPTTPTFPFKIGEKTKNPVMMYLSDIFTAGANLAGLPGIVVPCAWHEIGGKKLPVGLQILGAQKHDESILAVAEAYENFE